MPYRIERISSEKLGTHYGVFINETLIHYEFSRSAAEKVSNAMDSGVPLYEVLFEQINNFCLLKFSEELDKANKEIEQLKLKLDGLKKDSAKAKKSEIDPLSSPELAKRHRLSQVEVEELSMLLKDMKYKGFIYSSELSSYIKQHNLGSKYPNVSGIVTMQNLSDTWDFNGGFPRNIYRIVCQELGLVDKGTSAKAIDFLSYKKLGVK